MKLKLNKPTRILTEADPNRGHRLKYIQSIAQQLKQDLTTAGYIFSLDSDKGFQITPQCTKGYLAMAEIFPTPEYKSGTDFDDDSAQFEVIYYNHKGQETKLNTVILVDADAKMYDRSIAAVVEELMHLIGLKINLKLFENLGITGNQPILEYGPLSGVKNVVSKIKDKVDMKAAEKQEKRELSTRLNAVAKDVVDAAIEKISSKNGLSKAIKVSNAADKDSARILVEFTAPYLIAAEFEPDVINTKEVKISKLMILDKTYSSTSLQGKSTADLINYIYDAVGITSDFKAPKSEPEQASTADSPSNTTANSTWKELIGAEAFAELRIADESIANANTSQILLETYKLKIPADHYEKARKKAADKDAEYALVRYFLHKESNGIISEADAKKLPLHAITSIYAIIMEAGSFNPNVSPELLYILTSIQRYGTVKPHIISYAYELPAFCKNNTERFMENPQSIIYSPTLFNSSKDSKVLNTLLDYYYNAAAFSNERMKNLSVDQRKALATKLGLPDAFIKLGPNDHIKTKQYLLLDPTSRGENNKKFRELSVIELIEDMILGKDKANLKRKKSDEPVDIKDPDLLIKQVKSKLDAGSTMDADTFKTLLAAITKQIGSNQTLQTAVSKALIDALHS